MGYLIELMCLVIMPTNQLTDITEWQKLKFCLDVFLENGSGSKTQENKCLHINFNHPFSLAFLQIMLNVWIMCLCMETAFFIDLI